MANFVMEELNGLRSRNLISEEAYNELINNRTSNRHRSSYTGRLIHQYTVEVDKRFHQDLQEYLNNAKSQVETKILNDLMTMRGVKFYIIVKVLLEKLPDIENTAYFRSKAIAILDKGEVESSILNAHAQIVKHFEKYTNEGSGWSLNACLQFDLTVLKYKPFRGGTYIPTPKEVMSTHAVVNVQNSDNRCFEYSILSALHPAQQNPQRVSKYIQYINQLNFSGIKFPIQVSDITKFENINPEMSINVFGWWQNALYPIRVSNEQQRPHVIDLLLLANNDTSHYVWIKDLSRLIYRTSKHKCRKYPCRRCLHIFSREDLLVKHTPDCQGISEKPQRVDMPRKDERLLKFINHHCQMKVPYIIYADFECLNIPIGSTMSKLTSHEPCGFCYIVVRCDGVSNAPVLYRGMDTVVKFLQHLKVELTEINSVFSNPVEMTMTEGDVKLFEEVTHCHVCMKPLVKSDGIRDAVRDHCHLTGKFRGAAHNSCNLKLRIYPNKTKVPVVFHNLQGYDGHLIMAHVGSQNFGDITCIPNNMEKYLTFGIGQLQFIDSLQFMNCSLENLAANLVDFPIAMKWSDGDNIELLTRKGVYPYDYMDSWERFEETRLPPVESFYSRLYGCNISDGDYKHAVGVWDAFGIHNLGEYHDLYLKTDVLLLADIFEKFRETSLIHYGLDPAHYYTSPGMSWDALLKKTGIELELLTDIDMHLFIEKGIRGGISMVSHRYAKANNPMCPDYNPDLPNTWISYLDANNLYGWAMCQQLPVSDFKWVTNKSEFHKRPRTSEYGYIYEVDLEYPQNLHDRDSDYPLAPEQLEVEESWLSSYQQNLLMDRKMTECVKLVPTLRNKTKYVVHEKNLQFYIKMGMRVMCVHRVLQFRQAAWMKPYIEFNTNLRTQATTDFEKDFFKLMNNSVFGKTMENLRKRIRVDLVREKFDNDKLRRLIADPAFNTCKVFPNDLVAVHSKKARLKLNKPIYVGLSILDLSKLLMYKFYYEQIKPRYGDNVCLLYTDTDSLLLMTETPNIYDDMLSDIDFYDTSDYPKDHALFSTKNKKVVGKFKDECAGKPIIEFVGLRPKMYSIKTLDKEVKKAKGVTKSVIKKDLKHEMYVHS